MKKRSMMTVVVSSMVSLVFADTNALIEVKLFKTWVIAGEEFEHNFNLTITNTGSDPIKLFKDAYDFSMGQLCMRPLPRNPDTAQENERQEREYGMVRKDKLFELPPGETHVYEGRKFFITEPALDFSAEMRFTASVYLRNGVWLDSGPVTLYGVTPDAEKKVGTVGDANFPCDLVAVTYRNERWLYSKSDGGYFEICPVSLTGRIRAEPHEGKGRLYKIWDGDKSMIYQHGWSILLEGPDENDVLGKWTRERKRKADADNAEVRRKRGEEK